MKHKILPLLKAVRQDALRSGDAKLARWCKDLAREAVAEGREHRCLREFYGSGSFTLTDIGVVGRAVLILYVGNLFSSTLEKQRCIFSSLGSVKEVDLDLLVAAASRLRKLDCSPAYEEAIWGVLKRVCSTDYFLKEDLATASRVCGKIMAAGGDCHSQQLMNAILQAYREVEYVHYDSRSCNRLDFDPANPIDEVVALVVAPLEPGELLRGINDSPVLEQLTTRRPDQQSLIPHTEAVMVCIEHAVMWLCKSKLRVFYPLAVTYQDIAKLSIEDERLFQRFWNVRIPSPLERGLRVIAIDDSDALMDGDLHYVHAEDYKSITPVLLEDMSIKELEVLKKLAFHYRATAANLEYERSVACGIAADFFMEYGRSEPPQYRYLFT
ncbi:hypothetical protein SELMODRAFT_412909 [Selaginella moellendorffii]|uniref:Uncharacterized protein n=1 Tax=Selaginella moellendorffii TaxID=88036 RepID=D8RMQ6_SELML|nr:hypothetical protein SELMODRAFT_412909 [Selaginella moellendorffii]